MNENVGKLFASWEIIGIDTERGSNGSILYICKCINCGRKKSINLSTLKSTKRGCTCGKSNAFIDLTDKKFGLLTALYVDEELSTKDRTFWKCKCDCGNYKSMEAYRLKKTAKLPSCGCMTNYLIRDTRKKYNKYDLTGEYGIGWTSNTNEEFYFDLDDYDLIKDYCWYKNKQDGYIRKPKEGNSTKSVLLHQLILGIVNGDDNNRVDHIDKKRNNCRKYNLRICTHHQNNMNKGLDNRNKSGVSGVIWNKSNRCWQSFISYNEERFELGCYNLFEDAIKARLMAEEKYFKEFAPQQHLYEEYNIINDGILPIKRTKYKKIYCVETDKIYDSSKQIGEELNIKQNLINPVARGDKKSTNGYHFKYV